MTKNRIFFGQINTTYSMIFEKLFIVILNQVIDIIEEQTNGQNYKVKLYLAFEPILQLHVMRNLFIY